jgi:drug/metabolite transporter (DMT)-like permease
MRLSVSSVRQDEGAAEADVRNRRRGRFGAALVVASAASSGTAPVLAKLGYANGLAPEQLLSIRFVICAPVILLAAALVERRGWPAARRTLGLLSLGAFGFAGQALTFFWALQKMPASLTELLIFSYPAVVALETWMFTRRPVSARHVCTVGLSFVGVLLLVGANFQASALGLVLAAVCTVTNATYFTVGERLMGGCPPLAAAGLVMAGAGMSLSVAAQLSGHLQPGGSAVQWSLLMAMALVPTMLGITLLLVALPMIGALRASALSVVEPVVTVAVATVVLSERLTVPQFAGGALILGAVVALQRDRSTMPAVGVPDANR